MKEKLKSVLCSQYKNIISQIFHAGGKQSPPCKKNIRGEETILLIKTSILKAKLPSSGKSYFPIVNDSRKRHYGQSADEKNIICFIYLF